MKGGLNKLIVFLFFLLGALLCYVLCQYTFLQIDYEIKIVESIFDIITIVVGLYIATTINRNFNARQNTLSYLQPKLDLSWGKFNLFAQTIQNNNIIDLSLIGSFYKEHELLNSNLVNIYSTFNLDIATLHEIEKQLDILEDNLVNNSLINNNIVDYNLIKTALDLNINKINLSYAKAIQFIHSR